MKRTKPLKLFVWRDVLTDWTSGVMFAYAPDVETARRMLCEGEPEGGAVSTELTAEPEVWGTANCMKVWGGG